MEMRSEAGAGVLASEAQEDVVPVLTVFSAGNRSLIVKEIIVPKYRSAEIILGSAFIRNWKPGVRIHTTGF